MMNKIYVIATLLFAFSGCKENDGLIMEEQVELCKKKPSSIFCTTPETIGNIEPTKEYAMEVLRTMNKNYTPKLNDSWIYNDNVYEELVGDCEDIASTMAAHMINDGIDTKYLSLAYKTKDGKNGHIFLAVETSGSGILHLDYINSGYPIEANINFHMRMNSTGVSKWVKGNVSEIDTIY